MSEKSKAVKKLQVTNDDYRRGYWRTFRSQKILKVLVACEESQVVTSAFRSLGHDAYSCDILDCSGGHPEWHYQQEVEDIIHDEWDLIIAHPPCTHLSCSGAKHFAAKRADGRQQQGIDFFNIFTDLDCPMIAIENPVGIMSTHWRKPDQIIQPYEYGHQARKKTCLWLKGLPKLVPTEIVEPKLITYKDGSTFSADYMKAKRSKPGDSSRLRSKTYEGIARAMAEQWGKL